jgi:CRP-like cAMP-binding protein
MNNLLAYLNGISELEPEASDDLLKDFKTKTFNKNDFLLKPDEVCRYFYFVENGLTKSFSYNKNQEFIMAFFQENMMFTELTSYLAQKPSKYILVALEKTTVKYIHKDAIERHCNRHHSIETLVRKLFTITSVCFMDRISEMLEENAKERYNNFLKKYPDLLQRISLGDLANYIGITQVSLSRIRAAR